MYSKCIVILILIAVTFTNGSKDISDNSILVLTADMPRRAACVSSSYERDHLFNKSTNYSSKGFAIIYHSFKSSFIGDLGALTNELLPEIDSFSTKNMQEMAKLTSNAILSILQHFQWTRLALVSDGEDMFYNRVGELLHKYLSVNGSYNFYYHQILTHFYPERLLNQVTFENFNIVVLSVSSIKVKKIFAKRLSSDLKWPKHAWIIPSVFHSDKSEEDTILEGTVQLNVEMLDCTVSEDNYYSRLCNESFCSLKAQSVSINLNEGMEHIKLFNYSFQTGLEVVTPPVSGPTTDIPQYAPYLFIVLYYLGILVCFILVTVTLVLYIYYRGEPAIKATSTSLSILIFVGCYIWIFYLAVLNSTLLPSYHRQSKNIRNFICVFRVWLHGLGFPIALIMSTLLVKMMRIYHIFHVRKKLNKYVCNNLSLAGYVLLITSPNALICLLWSTSDPYQSELIIKISKGQQFITEQCRSRYTLQWLLGLLLYLAIVSLSLTVIATLTRRVKRENFNDTKKLSALSYLVILSLAFILSYWFFLRLLGANVVFVHAVLQLGHWSLIIQCQMLLFAPKLIPVLKNKFMRYKFSSSDN